ncbi:MAG: hypothetical protein ACK4GC_03160 [Paracoccaceae bacterium]
METLPVVQAHATVFCEQQEGMRAVKQSQQTETATPAQLCIGVSYEELGPEGDTFS